MRAFDSRDPRLGLTLVGLLGCAALLVMLDLAVNLPFNPWQPNSSLAQTLRAVLPQGWAFFTRDPREPGLRVYQLQGAAWVPALTHNAAPGYAFGANRAGRARHLELGWLMAALPADTWTSCRDTASGCLANLEAKALGSPLRDRVGVVPTLCGELGLVKAATPPWAWARHRTQARIEARVVRVVVSC